MLKNCFKILALSALIPFLGQAASAQEIKIATGGKTGVYYPVGNAICRLVKKQGVGCTAVSTQGSVENAKGLEKGDYQFALVQSDIQVQAQTGTKSFSDVGSLVRMRSVFSLHAEPLHLMVGQGVSLKKIDDLKGKKFSVGNPGSGSRAMADIVFREKGWELSDFPGAQALTSEDQVNALCKGTIDAAFWVAGLPNAATQGATSKCGVRILSLHGDWIENILLDYPQYVDLTIPAKLYATNNTKIRTFGPKATLLVNADVAQETVYKVTKTIFENLASFKEMHPALSMLQTEEMYDDAIISPLHPGAKKYYKEKGWVRF